MHFLHVHTIHVLSKNVKDIKVFRMKFLLVKKICVGNGHVFVMQRFDD